MSRQGDSVSTRLTGGLVRRRAVLGGLSAAAVGGSVCRDDYAAGRMVSVMNWLISRTEAELILLLG